MDEPIGFPLGDSEINDATNRVRWLACVTSHKLGVQYMQMIIDNKYAE